MGGTPFISRDVRELIGTLVKHGVQFVLVGGHAVAFHGFPRATMDIDFLVRPDHENARRMMAALAEFGFGHAGIPEEAFMREGQMVTIGAPPSEVDFVTSLSGCALDSIFANAVDGEVAGIRIKIIGRLELVATKRAANRNKDRIDLEELEAIWDEDAENSEIPPYPS